MAKFVVKVLFQEYAHTLGLGLLYLTMLHKSDREPSSVLSWIEP